MPAGLWDEAGAIFNVPLKGSAGSLLCSSQMLRYFVDGRSEMFLEGCDIYSLKIAMSRMPRMRP
jgi:hypothetical protein